ncbi:MAG: hypothetical protein NTV63_04260 [Candidatus Woesearchaeota archaeon]|nr:hypothetical protein [Candidatus Woesearchaeota archaeon]
MAEFLLMPPILFGLAIGLYETIFMTMGMGIMSYKFKYGLQAMIFSIIFAFASMNSGFVIGAVPFFSGIPFVNTALGFGLVVSIIAGLKVGIVSLILSNMGMSGNVYGAQRWIHSFVAAALVFAAPYAFPFVSNILPEFLRA